MILNKRKQLDKKQKINSFLDSVKNDYKKYFDYILREKQQQYYAMELLNKYVDDLIKTNKLAENDLENAKGDQYEILSEIGKIKKELDEISQENRELRIKLDVKNRQLEELDQKQNFYEDDLNQKDKERYKLHLHAKGLEKELEENQQLVKRYEKKIDEVKKLIFTS